MLDTPMIEQLREVFGRLDGPVTLRVYRSEHMAQPELDEMLNGLAAASPLIRVNRSDEPASAPVLDLVSPDGRSPIRFRGVPGGHEFTSLVLAILNSNGKGKIPDDGVLARIRAIRGPVRVKTFMSLSCENCPEVVQSLNLMATLHPDFEHETVDGAVAQDEIERLRIQGVPAVVARDGSGEEKLLHSGKGSLADLMGSLESHFGSTPAATLDLGHFDVAVIGGGPAGASAAIYSARKGLSTAMLAERFGGQLQETKGIENMISQAYTEGLRLSAQLAEHLSKYPVRLLEHRKVKSVGDRADDGSRWITLESGESLRARTVIIATGARWRELGIPGEREHIGQGVAFCAHCDGPFYRGRRVAVVGGGNSGVEATIDLAAIATQVTLLEFSDRLKADRVLIEKLQGLSNVRILLNARSTRVLGDGRAVSGLEYEDRASGEKHRIDLDGVFVQIGLSPNSQFVKGVVETTPQGEIVVDPKGRTTAKGIYAAGDVTTVPFKQIVIAMGEGAKVALTAFEDRMHAR
jgi:alkyl hydroperoxide reductase subunit F